MIIINGKIFLSFITAYEDYVCFTPNFPICTVYGHVFVDLG